MRPDTSRLVRRGRLVWLGRVAGAALLMSGLVGCGGGGGGGAAQPTAPKLSTRSTRLIETTARSGCIIGLSSFWFYYLRNLCTLIGWEVMGSRGKP
jgi:hypothetical protein